MYSRKHGPERGSAVAATRERSPPGSLELDVVAHAVTPHHLTQQAGAPVAKLRDEGPELVAGIGLRHGLGPLSHVVAGQNLNPVLAPERVRIKSQFPRQFVIQLHETWRRDRCGIQSRVKVLRQPRIRVVKAEANLRASQNNCSLQQVGDDVG